MSHKLAAISRITRAEAWLLLQSAVLLPIVSLSLRFVGFRKTYQWLYLPQNGEVKSDLTVVTRSINRASQNLPGFNPSCLPRSLVLWHLLRRRRAPAQFRIGVAKQDDKLIAHAWVESNGQVVNDQPDIAQHYSPIDLQILSSTGA